jgi:DNA invertase Pin-like site-specific DNA recombinase
MESRRFAVKPSSPAALRVAIYARVSTVNKGQDVGLQLDELRMVATQRGWKLTEDHVYVDDGISAPPRADPRSTR